MHRMIFLMLFVFIVSCSERDELSSLGVKATDTIPLLDTTGANVATLFLRGVPSSQAGSSPSQTQTTGVSFDAAIDLNRSPQALTAIQFNLPDPISVEIVFINTQRKEFVFTVNPPIPKGPNLTRVTLTTPLPLPLQEIAVIVLKVDGKEVAFHPPR